MRKLIFSIAVVLVLCTPSACAYAATVYANSSAGNDTTGNGSSESPYKTFHKAYTAASAGDSINLTGTFNWADAAETGDSSTSGYTLGKNLTIVGQGSDTTFIQAASASTTADRRVFTISSGVVITMSKVSIRNGRLTSTSYYGGGIANSGTLTISDSEISNNTAGGGGGGIDNLGTTTIQRAAIYNNTTVYMGGGVNNDYNIAAGGYLIIENSTIYNNHQTSTSGYLNGAGVNVRGGSAALTNNTITANDGKGGGGLGVDTTGTVYLLNNIIAGNTSATYGSTYNDIRRSSGTIADNGYNIIGQPGGITLATGDWSDTNIDGVYTLYSVGTTGSLNLDTGASANDSATSTPTYAILSGSIAINTGTTGSNGATSTVPSLDARGAARNGATDIGAFEFDGTGLTVTTPSSSASNITFSAVQYHQMTANWTAGTGARRVVFMKAAGSGTASPVDGTTYSPNAAFGSGDQIGSSGWYAVYDGHGTSVTVTGLSAATTYIVQIFEYNGVSTGVSVYDSGTATGNPAVQASYTPVTIYANASAGSDSGDGSSVTPYKTFTKAYSVSNPGDTIDLTGTFTWTDADETGDAITSGYTIGKDLTITGQDAYHTVLQTAAASTTGDRRVFTVSSGTTVTIKNLTIQNGRTTSSSQYGGGIANSGTLTLQHVDISNNSATGSGGGGLANYGTTTVENSSVWNNTAYYMGGGIVNIATGALLTLTNVTVFGNYQQSSVGYTEGGGITIRYGTATITHSTVAYNSSYSAGGGVYLDDPTGILYLENTIIANNTQRSGTSGSDFGKYTSASVTDNGGNIVGRSSGYTFSASGDWTDTDNNGTWSGVSGGSGALSLDTELSYNEDSYYYTYTLALTSESSIAVDVASTSPNHGVSLPATDQRTFSRSGPADIGAYEYGGTSSHDLTAPSVSLTAPVDSASVSGDSVALSADASDDTAVAGVSFYINGILQGSEDTTSPYGIPWDSTATSSGVKYVVAVARDTSGNLATSSSVSISVENEPTPTAVDATPTSSSADISWSTLRAGSTRVFFGISSTLASSTPEFNTGSRVTTHSVSLSGLPPCTVFRYVTVSTNAGSDTATSSQSTFATSGCVGSASITAHNEDSVSTVSGGTVSQGNLALIVPAFFTSTSSSASFQLAKLDQSTFTASAGTPAGVSLLGTDVFHLAAFTDATTTLSTFDTPLTVTMSYSASDVSSFDASTLKIYRYDAPDWSELSHCSVDTDARTVSCETTHFSDFAIFGSPSSDPDTSPALVVANGAPLGTLVVPAPLPRPQIVYPDGTIVYLDTPERAVVAAEEAAATSDFTRTLRAGSTGADVLSLQKYLNAHGYILAVRGPGSPENETDYFGSLTWNALVKFQEAHAEEILIPAGLSRGSGIFGSLTRAFVSAH